MAFSVQPNVAIPPSLLNIYKELQSDIGCFIPNNGYLIPWSDQGVLLLNTALTVRAHEANSHKGIGWETFTDRIIELLSERTDPVIFVLWGGNARKKKSLINNKKHYILEAAHPSPLSAYRGFFGCKHFSKINDLPFSKPTSSAINMCFLKCLYSPCTGIKYLGFKIDCNRHMKKIFIICVSIIFYYVCSSLMMTYYILKLSCFI